MTGQLAQMVRDKYPGAYDDLSDEQLEQAVVSKFPGVYDDLLEAPAPEPEGPPAPPEHPHARVGRAVVDAVKGAKAAALSTVYHGGDLVRAGWNKVAPEALQADRILDRPEVQDVITPPDSLAGKIGFFGEQAAEFAVPLTKLSKATQGMKLGKRMLVDAGASGAVAAVQSGGDAADTTTGTMIGGAVPAVGAGLRLVGGAVRRAAAGAKEGGVGGAVASAVRTAAPLDSNFMLLQGLKPRNTRVTFMKSLERAVPEIKAAEVELGKPIASIDDLLQATDLTKKRIRASYDAIAGAKRAIGTTVDLTSMADDMATRIPKKLRLEDPARAEALEAVADKYRRSFTLEEAEQLLKETNAELEAFYNKFPLGQRRALVKDPEAMRLSAQADGLRKAIYGALDAPGQSDGARALNRLYGDLLEVEDTALRRSNVAKRQQPESLGEQFAQARAAGDFARGAWRIARGDLRGAVDLAAGQAQRSTAKFIKEQQTTDALIRRAFEGVKTKPATFAKPVARPVRGMLERGAIPMDAGPDGSYVRSVSAQVAIPERPALPPARTVREAGPGPDPSGPIAPTLPENYEHALKDQAVPDFGLDDVPATSAKSPDEMERSFMLRWLADDLDEMRFEKGGTTVRGRQRAAEELDDEAAAALQFNPRVAGTPTQEMFHALGINGSRADIARKIQRALSGKKSNPKLELLADAMREAWDGKQFDWQLVSDETIAKLGIRRRDLRSPITLPNQDDMPEMFARLLGGGE